MNLFLLFFILVSWDGSLGAVVASYDENLVIELIERLETEKQELMNERDELKRAKEEEKVEKEKLDIENKKLKDEILRLEPFKIAGDWSAWGNWSSCDSLCGGGVRERRRLCDNPSPSCGGPECVGNETETASCNEHSCGTQAIFIGGYYRNGARTSTEVLDLDSNTCS